MKRIKGYAICDVVDRKENFSIPVNKSIAEDMKTSWRI